VGDQLAIRFYALLCRSVNRDNAALWGVSAPPEIRRQLHQFGVNLRRERAARRMSQERLAELSDLNLRTVQKIEAGQTNILVTTAKRLQKALACPWNSLME
jgi:DNA-binding XRE family transcriptional regulator